MSRRKLRTAVRIFEAFVGQRALLPEGEEPMGEGDDFSPTIVARILMELGKLAIETSRALRQSDSDPGYLLNSVFLPAARDKLFLIARKSHNPELMTTLRRLMGESKTAVANTPREMERMFEEALTALNHIEASAGDFGFSPEGAAQARKVMLRSYQDWTRAKRSLSAADDKDTALTAAIRNFEATAEPDGPQKAVNDWLGKKSKISTLIQEMSKAAKKGGASQFGMRDAKAALKAWFDGGAAPTDKKLLDAYEYLRTPKGKKAVGAISKGVIAVLKKAGGGKGFRDVAKAVDTWMGY